VSDFKGRTAIVTGAANGIGRAITEGLIQRGARVVAVDMDAGDLNAAFGDNDSAHCLVLDVTARDAPGKIVAAAVERFGGLDFLINNAGIAIAGEFETLTDEQWDTIMDVNVRSMFRLSREAVPELKKSEQARVINLGSIMSDLGGPTLAIYGASKHAVAGLSKGMAVDLGKYDITVNYLQPGAIWTKMSRPFMDDPDFKAYWEGKAPAGRLGQPEEVASAAMYLLSEEARFVSGLGFNVDGGAIVKF
jgi:NAD(P)-dependent dehydrogenase (short-subunit alcohol dehydrogenase family)